MTLRGPARLVVAAVVLWAAVASGQVYDLTRYGAIPGDRAATVNVALDRLRFVRGGNLRDATIELPGAALPYYADRPILLDDDRVTLAGDGSASQLRSTASFAPLCLGVSRAPLGRSLAADRYLPLAGRLDASVPAGKCGLDLRSDTHLSFIAEAFDTGGATRWETLRSITLDFALEWPEGQKNSIVCGVGDPIASASPGPRPLAVWSMADGRYRIDFRTRDRDGTLAFRSAYLPAPPGTVHRVSVSIDLDRAEVVAFAGDRAVPISPSSGLTPRDGWVPNGRLSFLENEWMPFEVGGYSRYAHHRGEHPYRAGPIRLLGFRLAKGVRYTADRDGTQRLGGSPATDNDRYFLRSGDLIGLLPLDQSAPGPDGGRLVRVAHGGGVGDGFGYWLHSGVQGGGLATVDRITVRDLDIGGGGAGGYGQGVAVGACTELRLSGLTVRGGWHGIGSLAVGPVYPIWMRDIRASGPDASIYGNTWICSIDDLFGGAPGRVGIRLISGHYTIRDGWFNTSNTARSIVVVHGDEIGGVVEIDDLEQDGEDPGYPSRAGIEVENSYVGPTAVFVRNLRLSLLGPDASAIVLHDVPPDAPASSARKYGPATLSVEGLRVIGRTHRAQVTTDGPRWRGVVRGLIAPDLAAPGGEVAPAVRADGDGPSNVRVEGAAASGPQASRSRRNSSNPNRPRPAIHRSILTSRPRSAPSRSRNRRIDSRSPCTAASIAERRYRRFASSRDKPGGIGGIGGGRRNRRRDNARMSFMVTCISGIFEDTCGRRSPAPPPWRPIDQSSVGWILIATERGAA